MVPSGDSVYISGIGGYEPKKRLTNQDLEAMLETSDEWITTRTGIKERRIAGDEETTATMGVQAAEVAIQRAGIDKQEIDLLVLGTMTPDLQYPSTACLVQAALGLTNTVAFDVGAACSGFIHSLEVASKLLAGGHYRNALVVGSEVMSRVLDWSDRSTCVLFGDGAGAVVLSKTAEPGYGIIDSVMGADGSQAKLLYQPAGGSARGTSQETIQNGEHFLKMNGREVFKHAVKMMESSALELLKRHNIEIDAIKHVVPHQANQRIIEALSSRMGIDLDRFVINLDRYGNTSAASIPLALNEGFESGCFKRGDLILLTAFGAGLTWGATLIRWF